VGEKGIGAPIAKEGRGELGTSKKPKAYGNTSVHNI